MQRGEAVGCSIVAVVVMAVGREEVVGGSWEVAVGWVVGKVVGQAVGFGRIVEAGKIVEAGESVGRSEKSGWKVEKVGKVGRVGKLYGDGVPSYGWNIVSS